MGQKTTPDEARRILVAGGYLPADPDHAPTWTDGLPHDFTGWGPKTPDPDHPEPPAEPAPDSDLHWQGGEDLAHHTVWRFDRRRSRH